MTKVNHKNTNTYTQLDCNCIYIHLEDLIEDINSSPKIDKLTFFNKSLILINKLFNHDGRNRTN